MVTHIWGDEGDGDERFVKNHIRRLRQKIEPDPSYPHFIITVVGVGYTFLVS
jgi:DNA-binding response OmpR family regulator